MTNATIVDSQGVGAIVIDDCRNASSASAFAGLQRHDVTPSPVFERL